MTESFENLWAAELKRKGILLATTLPTAIVAWREPDPKPDEDESA